MLEKSTYDKHWIKSSCKVVCLYAMNIQKCKTATICIYVCCISMTYLCSMTLFTVLQLLGTFPSIM